MQSKSVANRIGFRRYIRLDRVCQRIEAGLCRECVACTVTQQRIDQRDLREEKITADAAFEPPCWIGDHAGAIEFAAGARRGRNGDDGKGVSPRLGFLMQIVGGGASFRGDGRNRLGAIDRAAASEREDHVRAKRPGTFRSAIHIIGGRSRLEVREDGGVDSVSFQRINQAPGGAPGLKGGLGGDHQRATSQSARGRRCFPESSRAKEKVRGDFQLEVDSPRGPGSDSRRGIDLAGDGKVGWMGHCRVPHLANCGIAGKGYRRSRDPGACRSLDLPRNLLSE